MFFERTSITKEVLVEDAWPFASLYIPRESILFLSWISIMHSAIFTRQVRLIDVNDSLSRKREGRACRDERDVYTDAIPVHSKYIGTVL